MPEMHRDAEKSEGGMLQLELYVSDVGQTSLVFEEVFGLHALEKSSGWCHLRHPRNFDIMLFSPQENDTQNTHWALPSPGTGGQGIEIVICCTGISEKLEAVRRLGYTCTDLRHPPWGGAEFIFHLEEGYLIRAKQPR